MKKLVLIALTLGCGAQLVQAEATNKQKLELFDRVCKSLIKQMNKNIENLKSERVEYSPGRYVQLTIDENSNYRDLYDFWSMDDETSVANQISLAIQNWSNECGDLTRKMEDEQRELMTSTIQQLEAMREKNRIATLAITHATRVQLRELYKEEREYLLSE